MIWHFALTCPRCGGDVQPVTVGVSNGWEARAVAHCDPCRQTYLLAATVTHAHTRYHRPTRRKVTA